MVESIVVFTILYVFCGLVFSIMYTDFNGGLEKILGVALVWPVVILRWVVQGTLWLGRHGGGIARASMHEAFKEVRR